MAPNSPIGLPFRRIDPGTIEFVREGSHRFPVGRDRHHGHGRSGRGRGRHGRGLVRPGWEPPGLPWPNQCGFSGSVSTGTARNIGSPEGTKGTQGERREADERGGRGRAFRTIRYPQSRFFRMEPFPPTYPTFQLSPAFGHVLASVLSAFSVGRHSRIQVKSAPFRPGPISRMQTLRTVHGDPNRHPMSSEAAFVAHLLDLPSRSGESPRNACSRIRHFPGRPHVWSRRRRRTLPEDRCGEPGRFRITGTCGLSV